MWNAMTMPPGPGQYGIVASPFDELASLRLERIQFVTERDQLHGALRLMQQSLEKTAIDLAAFREQAIEKMNEEIQNNLDTSRIDFQAQLAASVQRAEAAELIARSCETAATERMKKASNTWADQAAQAEAIADLRINHANGIADAATLRIQDMEKTHLEAMDHAAKRAAAALKSSDTRYLRALDRLNDAADAEERSAQRVALADARAVEAEERCKTVLEATAGAETRWAHLVSEAEIHAAAAAQDAARLFDAANERAVRETADAVNSCDNRAVVMEARAHQTLLAFEEHCTQRLVVEETAQRLQRAAEEVALPTGGIKRPLPDTPRPVRAAKQKAMDNMNKKK